MFVPPYSPDFNPVEMASAKIQALLRQAAERTVAGLRSRIGEITDLVAPDEAEPTSEPPDMTQTERKRI